MSNKISAVVIDDEKHALDLFQKVLTLFENPLYIEGLAQSLPKAINLINEKKPELVFMDIDMPNYSGLQINDFFPPPRSFELIYVTAHQNFVLDALRIQAFDYLYKPIEITALQNTIERYIDRKVNQKALPFHVKQNHEKIALNSQKGTKYINIEEIAYISAEGMYCTFHLTNEKVIVSKPLSEFDYLQSNYFFRSHRSFMVNLNHVEGLSTENGYEIILKSKKQVPLSRSKKDEFKAIMNDSLK